MAAIGSGRSRSGARPSAPQARSGLSKVPNAGKSPGAVRSCPLAGVLLHTVVVQARWRDSGENVPAVACRIVLGDTVVVPGPLANGTLGQGGLVGGAYEVTLPEVDADEWDLG